MVRPRMPVTPPDVARFARRSGTMATISPAGPILPALVQPAPAIEPVHPGEGPAPSAGLAAAPAGAAGGPPSRLEVPAEFLARLSKAVEAGVADADEFASEHTPSERWMVPDWALMRMKFPPRSDEEELKFLHQVARTRTPEGVAAARYWSEHGLTDEWEKLLESYTRRVGPAQARAASKLLHDALSMTYSPTQIAKGTNARRRPFAVDPSLPLAVPKPGNNPSYPSGHASAAFAAGMVLSYLMPDRRAEFMGIANEASWARVYSGVHFPSDVLAGVQLAATVTSYLTRNSMARPQKGTAPAGGNTGVAGGRPLPGAVALTGTPIPGAPLIAGAPHASPAAAVMGQGQPGA